MKQEERIAIIVDLIDQLNANDSWAGETHVQKCGYFLQEGLGIPTDIEFVLYKHGPYSFELHDMLVDMQTKLMISRQPRPRPYGPSIVATDSGSAYRERQSVSKYHSQVEFVSQKIGDRGVSDLERLSTALYVSKQLPGASSGRRAQEITVLKPHITRSLAEDAIHECDELLKTAD